MGDHAGIRCAVVFFLLFFGQLIIFFCFCFVFFVFVLFLFCFFFVFFLFFFVFFVFVLFFLFFFLFFFFVFFFFIPKTLGFFLNFFKWKRVLKKSPKARISIISYIGGARQIKKKKPERRHDGKMA